MGERSSLLDYGCFYVLGISLFYFHAFVILKRISTKRSIPDYMVTGALALLTLGIYIYFSVILNNAFKGVTGIELVTHITIGVAISAGWRGIYFMALSSGYYAARWAINANKESSESKIKELKSQNENERLEKKIVMLQNAYLRAQINPHFLFNTLNFIYNQAEEKHPDVTKNISLLSEIMHYSLIPIEKDGKVSLTQELNQIKRYITLNLSRFDNTLFLEHEITFGEEAKNANIPPLIIFTFIENVFKHGDMTHKDTPAIIQISYAGNTLLVYTRNKKRRPRPKIENHVGLKNTLLRLYEAFPQENITLSTEDNETIYEFRLKLNL